MNATTAENRPFTDRGAADRFLAGLLMELGRTPATAQPGKLPLKIWCVMAVTTVLTFATLTTGYQMLFARHLFA